MPAIITMSITRSPTLQFDMSYYLSHHMPLVSQKWAKHGLRSWDVIESDKDSPYFIQCMLLWDSATAFETAVAQDGKEVFDDVEKFTNAHPIVLKGEVKKHWMA